MMLVLCMGLAFELPLVTWLLSFAGSGEQVFLAEIPPSCGGCHRDSSCLITPTGDPFTLSVVAIPLYLLYEMSILMIKDKKKTEEKRK